MPARISIRLDRVLRPQSAAGVRAARIGVVLLVFLLAFTQQAAVLHSLAHFAGIEQARATPAAAAGAPDHRGGALDAYCDKCYQFAHLSGLAFGQAGVLALPTPGAERALATVSGDHCADAPRAQSRGPPFAI